MNRYQHLSLIPPEVSRRDRTCLWQYFSRIIRSKRGKKETYPKRHIGIWRSLCNCNCILLSWITMRMTSRTQHYINKVTPHYIAPLYTEHSDVSLYFRFFRKKKKVLVKIYFLNNFIYLILRYITSSFVYDAPQNLTHFF